MSNRPSTVKAVRSLLFCLLTAGCATFPGAMEGGFAGPGRSTPATEDVSVLFLLRHVKQSKGLDAIPKLKRENQIVRDFPPT